MYAGALGDNAVERYALFLTSLALSADPAERRIALQRAREHGLDVPRVAIVTAERTIERALDNLVQNALRYGPERGRVTVTALQENGVARLSVSDEGHGLQPYEAARAFERFWRGEHGKPGSGLGLAIVRATAERHGGRATVEGARFTIELPALKDLSESTGRTEAPNHEKGSP